MDRVAGDLYNGALFAALWMTGLGLGLSSSAAEFLAPLRNFSLLASLIVLDAVAIPLLVWALTHLFNLPRDAAIVCSSLESPRPARSVSRHPALPVATHRPPFRSWSSSRLPTRQPSRYGWPCCCRLVSSFRSVN
jgi:hypothetical protein